MEKILDILKVIQSEQKAMQGEQREFRAEVNDRLKTIEKYAIHNGEKLDNNRDHVGKKMSFIEHKNLELEQRIYELESHFEQQ